MEFVNKFVQFMYKLLCFLFKTKTFLVNPVVRTGALPLLPRGAFISVRQSRIPLFSPRGSDHSPSIVAAKARRALPRAFTMG